MYYPHILYDYLKTHCHTLQLWVAYSGGVDSHVLLHSLANLRSEFPEMVLQAVHIHHGLHPHASTWAAHCQQVCEGLQVACVVKKIDVNSYVQGRSIEEVARELRYLTLSELLPQQGYLLTGHTQDDQAETLLQQLFRGGVRGLAGMPHLKSLGKGKLLRPFLNVSREAILAYAKAENLQWIEDSSNQDDRFDRNYVRHRILPVLETRWQGIRPVLARVARHCAQTHELLDEMAQEDRQAVQGKMPNTLSVIALKGLSVARQKNVLRFWLRQLGLQVPNTVKLAHIQQDFLYSRSDATPKMQWEGTELRRYRDDLYAFAPLMPFDNQVVIPWDLQAPLVLPAGLGVLTVDGYKGEKVSVRFRQGGERLQLNEQQGSRSLKKLFQEWGVPPWQRDRMPLIFNGEALIAVAKSPLTPIPLPRGEKGFSYLPAGGGVASSYG